MYVQNDYLIDFFMGTHEVCQAVEPQNRIRKAHP